MSPSEEVNDAEGAAPARVDVIELLAEKRAALDAARERYKIAKSARDEQQMSSESRVIDSLLILIPELEQDASVVREAAGRKAAEDRLTGIRRAHGSTVASYQDDEKQVEQAVAALSEAIAKVNSRAKKLEALKAEASALSDRFGLPLPLLTTVSEPQLDLSASLPAPWRLRAQHPSFEADVHGLRGQRRDYLEIGGTPGYAIIQTAGLRPFRPLTEREAAALEDKDERKPDSVLAAAVVEATALSNLRVPGGHVHRG
jgi:hypothetical protein